MLASPRGTRGKKGIGLSIMAGAMALVFAGCDTVPVPESVRNAARQLPEGVTGAIVKSADADAETAPNRKYVMGPGDHFDLVLRGTGTSIGKLVVGADGRADLPFGGNRLVAGETVDQLEKFLSYKREKETRDPTAVDAQFLNVKNVYLIGEVKQPGSVSYTSGLTLGDALQAQGGANHRAEARAVWIKPRHADSEIESAFDPALPLLPGDTVRIKERYF